MDTTDPTTVFLDESRFWIQRVVVPILVCIGVGGNTVSIMVLTRKRMRSSTNTYLTALAVADLVYLLFVFLLSFQHYPYINDRKYELYWRFYGISHWLCDAASSTSVWLTVSFTIERYIVVCHPMKGKVLCTESRAKSIIVIVSILCFIMTATTPFEYQLSFKDDCIKLCDEDELRSLHPYQINEVRRKHEVQNNTLQNDNYPDNYTINDLQTYLPSETNCEENINSENDLVPMNDAMYVFTNSTKTLFYTIVKIMLLNMTCCVKNYTISTEATALGKNRTYQSAFYWFSAIVFAVLPLAMIATFNCFLVNAVYKSYQKRNLMTNSQEKRSQNQENRITVLLIAVVVLFLICQVPTASLLIYNAVVEFHNQAVENIKMGLGNIFNSLLTLNASCNFILYCALSDKYRRTFKAMFFHRSLDRQDSLSGTRQSLRLGRTKLLKRVKSDYPCTPRNLEAHSLNSIPRSKSLMQRPLGNAKANDLLA